jgi:O-antigen ligase
VLRPGTGYGQFINKNHFAYLMEMAFGLAVGLLVSGAVKRQHGMLYVALLLPIWTGLVLSNSRGGILAMFAQISLAILLIGYLRHVIGDEDSRITRAAHSKAMRFATLAILILAVAIGTVWVGGDRLITNFEATGSEFSSSSPASPEGVTRNEIWRATLRTFAAHPILGVGLGGYSVAITAHHEGSGKMTPQEAHNEYLELLASGGIVGFAIGLWFAFEVFRVVRANLRSTSKFRAGVCFGAVLGIGAVAVHSFFDFGLHLLANALIFAVLIVMATEIPENAAQLKNGSEATDFKLQKYQSIQYRLR